MEAAAAPAHTIELALLLTTEMCGSISRLAINQYRTGWHGIQLYFIVKHRSRVTTHTRAHTNIHTRCRFVHCHCLVSFTSERTLRHKATTGPQIDRLRRR